MPYRVTRALCMCNFNSSVMGQLDMPKIVIGKLHSFPLVNAAAAGGLIRDLGGSTSPDMPEIQLAVHMWTCAWHRMWTCPMLCSLVACPE